jgi:hypothetical protein
MRRILKSVAFTRNLIRRFIRNALFVSRLQEKNKLEKQKKLPSLKKEGWREAPGWLFHLAIF